MKYYIGTVHQNSGDREYNRKNFQNALTHYVKGLTKLESIMDNQPDAIFSTAFYDSYVYALADVVYIQSRIMNKYIADSQNMTTDQLLQSLSDFSSSLTTISSRIALMNEFWEKICDESRLKTKPQRINFTNESIAESLELLSDLWSATAEELNSIPSDYERLINNSLTAMKLAIETKSRIPKGAEINMHLGYLNLLEQLCSVTTDGTHRNDLLNNMEKHLESYQLLTVLPKNSLSQLELISYALFVDTELHQRSNPQLIKQGYEIIASITKRTPDNEGAISAFIKLADRATHLPQEGRASSSSSLSLSDSLNPGHLIYDGIKFSSPASFELVLANGEYHPLKYVVRMFVENSERVNQLVDKLYTVGIAEFCQLCPDSPISLLVKIKTPSEVKDSLNDIIKRSDKKEQLELLIPALVYIANDHIKQAINPENSVRQLYESGLPWQHRAIFSSFKIQTATRTTAVTRNAKRTSMSSGFDSSLFSSSVVLNEAGDYPEETPKKMRTMSTATIADSESRADDDALEQWNLIKDSDAPDLSEQYPSSPGFSPARDDYDVSRPSAPTDSEQCFADEVPALALTLEWVLDSDSDTDSDHSILAADNSKPAAVLTGAHGGASNYSFFSPASQHKPGQQSHAHQSHPKVLAFIHAMHHINSKELEQRLEKKLFANLLTIMGEFLEVDPGSPLQKYAATLLTVESLYKRALVIDPNHNMARDKLKKLQFENKIILANLHYNVLVSDDIKAQSDKEHFCEEVDNALTELEALYLTEPKECGDLVCKLFSFITAKILKYNLMTDDVYHEFMTDFYGFREPSASEGCSSSSQSLSF
ncbi:hypothetical protein [Legionella worsleiensis]|uniref:Uncharacterized protein n=1 Tax=Legionella worsleiensis TaxID=45076 RepID=A0A0W1A9E9_9GAMM|nr:hypothetical protein [Legionella worsleiensis]KTD77949.1 hypothetical protein Lwor_1831 [Legionella worsleiensis]STY31614.1 Uncharacterised protein [Legionella worsleiensis]